MLIRGNTSYQTFPGLKLWFRNRNFVYNLLLQIKFKAQFPGLELRFQNRRFFSTIAASISGTPTSWFNLNYKRLVSNLFLLLNLKPRFWKHRIYLSKKLIALTLFRNTTLMQCMSAVVSAKCFSLKVFLQEFFAKLLITFWK